MDIRTYFNQRAAHWDDGEQSVDQIRRMIAFLSDIQEGMSFGCCLWYRGDV